MILYPLNIDMVRILNIPSVLINFKETILFLNYTVLRVPTLLGLRPRLHTAYKEANSLRKFAVFGLILMPMCPYFSKVRGHKPSSITVIA